MWIFYGVLPTVIVLALVAGAIALIMRGRGADGWNIQFQSVLLGYCAVAMLVGVFMAAAGGAFLLKAGFAEWFGRDFSYNAVPYQQWRPDPVTGEPERVPELVDPSDAQIRDDIASGISLVFAGGVVFAIHAFGAAVIRRGQPAGELLITRAYNTIGLAVASIVFLGAGATALNDLVRRYVVGGETVNEWEIRHPGEPLSVALMMIPLVIWFALRVWQEMSEGGAPKTGTLRASSAASAAA